MTRLAILQKELLSSGNSKDYYVLESVLKGNYLIKQNWKEQGMDLGLVNVDRIMGLTLNKFNPSNMQAKVMPSDSVEGSEVFGKGPNKLDGSPTSRNAGPVAGPTN